MNETTLWIVKWCILFYRSGFINGLHWLDTVYFQSCSSCFLKILPISPNFVLIYIGTNKSDIGRERAHVAAILLLELTGNKCLPQRHKSIDGHAHEVIQSSIAVHMWNRFEYSLLSHPCANRLTGNHVLKICCCI